MHSVAGRNTAFYIPFCRFLVYNLIKSRPWIEKQCGQNHSGNQEIENEGVYAGATKMPGAFRRLSMPKLKSKFKFRIENQKRKPKNKNVN